MGWLSKATGGAVSTPAKLDVGGNAKLPTAKQALGSDWAPGADTQKWWDSLTGATAKRHGANTIKSAQDEINESIKKGQISEDEYKARTKALKKLAAGKDPASVMSPKNAKKYKVKVAKVKKAALAEAARLKMIDPPKAAQLTQIASNIEKQMGLTAKMDPVDVGEYLQAEAVRLGAPPDISLVDVMTADASNFAQIGAVDAAEAASIGEMMQAQSATIQAAGGFEGTEIAEIAPTIAAATAEQTALGSLGRLEERAVEGVTGAQQALQYQQAAEDVQKGLASQVASQRGEVNPAMQRELLRQQAAATQGIAGEQATAAVAEGQRREEALAGIAAQQQGQQISGQALTQEQAIAQAQLSQQAGMQGADIQSQQAMQQAQLQQQTGLANQQAMNEAMLQQAGFQQQAGMLTSEQAQARAIQQAQLQQQAMQMSGQQQFQLGMNQQDIAAQQAQMASQWGLQQGQMGQQAMMQNVQGDIQRQNLMAQLAQQAQAGNQQAALQMAQMQGEMQQQANLAGYQGQITQAGQQASMQQQANLANQAAINAQQAQQAQLQQTAYGQTAANNLQALGMNQQNQQFYNAMLQQGQQQQAANQLTGAGIQANVLTGMQSAQAAKDASMQGLLGSGMMAGATAIGSLGTAGGTGAAAAAPTVGTAAPAASDENLKFAIEETSSEDVKSFLSSLKSKNYKYKDEKWGEGEYTGFMIQDIEDTKLGKRMVMDTEEGKMYDTRKMQGTMLASIKYLHNELLKQKKKK